MDQKSRRVPEKTREKNSRTFVGSFCGGDDDGQILIRRLSLTMTTMRMIVDDCVDSLTVYSGFINRIADKLMQLTVKSQGVYFFGHGAQLHSVCVHCAVA